MHTLSHKDIATQFLLLAASGRIDEAYETYVDMSGKHHNAYFPAGFAALKDAMKESDKQTPNKQFTPKLVIAEGELVAVYSHLVRAAEAPHIAVTHMFRIQNGKIVEMWDCGMELPAESPNADGAF